MTTNELIEIFIALGALIGVYVKLQTKIKELDMKMIALEAKIISSEKQDDRIMDKLDEITDSLTELKIQINNKQDRQ